MTLAQPQPQPQPQRLGGAGPGARINPKGRTRRVVWTALAILLGLHALLASWAILRTSVTVDEANHLPAGISYLQRKTFEVYRQNPPLVKLLGAGAALAAGARSDYKGYWRFARRTRTPINYAGLSLDFQRVNAKPEGHYQRVHRAARLVVLCFSLIGGLLIFAWARSLFGDAGGLIAAALWCLSPNVIANASVFTTDVPAAVVMFGATWAFWSWLQRPSWRYTLGVGLLLGIAQLVKFSAGILLVLWPLLALVVLWRGDWLGLSGFGSVRQRLGALAGRALVMLAVCVVVINAGYLFQGTGRRLGDFDFLSTLLTKVQPTGLGLDRPSPYQEVHRRRVNRFRESPLAGLPVPLPEHYLLGFDEVSFEMNPSVEGYGLTVYLRGELRRGGWWYYSLYALMAKATPGAVLVLLGAALAFGLAARTRAGWSSEAFLLVTPTAIFLAMSFLSEMNIGVRYALICFPFAMVWCGRLGRLWESRRVAAALCAALALHALSTLTIAPHFLAYFSPVVGGPRHGHEHLIDSNLDWGQDLLELRRVLDRRGHEGSIPASLWTNMDPALAGLEVTLIPRDPKTLELDSRIDGRDRDEPERLEPGLYAVSVNYVMGLPWRRLLSDRMLRLPLGAYAYFQGLEPVDRAGYSIWLYELSSADCDRLNAELGLMPGR